MKPFSPGPWDVTPFEGIRCREADPYDLTLDESQIFPVLILGRGVNQPGNARLIRAAPALAFAWTLVAAEERDRIFALLRSPDLDWVEAAIRAFYDPSAEPEGA